MDALFCLLESEEKDELWRLYMAQIGEGMCRAMGYNIPPYAEIIGVKKADTRTGRQIVDDMLADMKKRFGRKEE